MNNKGFAVSSVLYAILISFLLFLGVALAMFSSANNITLSANDDIVNGTGFSARRIVDDTSSSLTSCNNNGTWNSVSDRLIKINSRYGVVYWPKDFKLDSGKYKYSNKISADGVPVNKTLEQIKGDYMNKDFDYGDDITFTDLVNGDEVKVRFYDVCK